MKDEKLQVEKIEGSHTLGGQGGVVREEDRSPPNMICLFY